jgi:hypothetical protein
MGNFSKTGSESLPPSSSKEQEKEAERLSASRVTKALFARKKSTFSPLTPTRWEFLQ